MNLTILHLCNETILNQRSQPRVGTKAIESLENKKVNSYGCNATPCQAFILKYFLVIFSYSYLVHHVIFTIGVFMDCSY